VYSSWIITYFKVTHSNTNNEKKLLLLKVDRSYGTSLNIVTSTKCFCENMHHVSQQSD